MKGINLRISEFKDNLTNCINNSHLPPGIVQPIVELALNQLISQNTALIIQEKQAFEKEGEKQDGQSVL